jgi:hypothetical protein
MYPPSHWMFLAVPNVFKLKFTFISKWVPNQVDRFTNCIGDCGRIIVIGLVSQELPTCRRKVIISIREFVVGCSLSSRIPSAHESDQILLKRTKIVKHLLSNTADTTAISENANAFLRDCEIF